MADTNFSKTCDVTWNPTIGGRSRTKKNTKQNKTKSENPFSSITDKKPEILKPQEHQNGKTEVFFATKTENRSFYSLNRQTTPLCVRCFILHSVDTSLFLVLISYYAFYHGDYLNSLNSQGAETKKWEFRSTIATENIWHLILVEKDLLMKAW